MSHLTKSVLLFPEHDTLNAKKRKMVSDSPSKDTVLTGRCAENMSDLVEKRNKTTPKHIRISPPMFSGHQELKNVSHIEKKESIWIIPNYCYWKRYRHDICNLVNPELPAGYFSF